LSLNGRVFKPKPRIKGAQSCVSQETSIDR
jgi:hypothetical protein